MGVPKQQCWTGVAIDRRNTSFSLRTRQADHSFGGTHDALLYTRGGTPWRRLCIMFLELLSRLGSLIVINIECLFFNITPRPNDVEGVASEQPFSVDGKKEESVVTAFVRAPLGRQLKRGTLCGPCQQEIARIIPSHL
jgi:hypothetical protein